MPRKKNGMALRRWMRGAKKRSPKGWRPGAPGRLDRADQHLAAEFHTRIAQFSKVRAHTDSRGGESWSW